MTKTLMLCAVLCLSLPASAAKDQPIADDAMGLSKTSVYDTPAPEVFEYGTESPGTSKPVPASYHTAPPMIPHDISGFVPITRESNLCKGCHLQPAMVGKKVAKGKPVPMPASHYVDVAKGEPDLARHVCTQCHAPQAKVKVLVESNFEQKRR